MQVGRHRGGRGHRVGQPEVERKLRAFCERPQQDQQQCRNKTRIGLDRGHVGRHGAELVGTGNLPQQHEATQHRQAAAAGNGQGLPGAGAGVGAVAPEADQQERRDAGQLPEHHQQQQVVRKHHAQHGGHEQHHEAEKLAGGILGRQVVGGIEDDQQSDEQDQPGEHHRQAVQPERQVQADFGHPGPGIRDGGATHDTRSVRQQQRQRRRRHQARGGRCEGPRPGAQPCGQRGTHEQWEQNNNQQHISLSRCRPF